MATVIGAFATTHAYTFLDPTVWTRRRELSRANYQRRFGALPPERPEIGTATSADNALRYRNIRAGLDFVQRQLQALKPDVIILIGDDQDENFVESNLPQFAMFVGNEYSVADRSSGKEFACRSDGQLARFLLREMVEANFDMASSSSFEREKLRSHAHTEPLNNILPYSQVSVLPIFLNAIHVPAPSPSRCAQFGRALRTAITRYPKDLRIVLGASGGLSHYTAGYPYEHCEGPHAFGAIKTDFDRRLMSLLEQGRLSELCRLTNRDLIDNGDVEFRQWIAMLGALNDGVVPELLVYEPFYSALMGMGVGFWPNDG
jgi:hypothetical protein